MNRLVSLIREYFCGTELKRQMRCENSLDMELFEEGVPPQLKRIERLEYAFNIWISRYLPNALDIASAAYSLYSQNPIYAEVGIGIGEGIRITTIISQIVNGYYKSDDFCADISAGLGKLRDEAALHCNDSLPDDPFTSEA